MKLRTRIVCHRPLLLWLRTSKDHGQEKSRDSKLGREFDRVVKPSTREADKEVSRKKQAERRRTFAVSYTHLRAHETREELVCRLLLEKKK